MAADWIECTLADACSSIDYGLTDSAVDQKVGPKFLRITDIVSGYIDWNSVPYVAADPETATKYRLHDGDIVLARTGASTGASAYVKSPPESVFASYLVRLKTKPEFDSRFVGYYLKSELFWTFIRGVLGDKSAQPNASASTMTKAPFRAPKDTNKQRAIAYILGTLDDKIELNRRMNETLEKMALALFKSWFVDFDPVRAKAEGRDPRLPKVLANLFPDSLEDSELGEIPSGWRVGELQELASVSMGLSPAGESYNANGVGTPLINGPVEFGEYFSTKSKWTTAPTRMAEAGDLIFCVRGSTTGRRVVADDAYCLGRGVCALHPRTVSRAFLYQLINVELNRLLSKTTGSVFPSLSAPDIKKFPVIIPSPEASAAFGRFAQPLTERVEANVTASNILAALRDTFLPKLISGELRVKAAEQQVEAAL